MQRLLKLLKFTTKLTVITSIIGGGAVAALMYVKYPFETSVGPQQETRIIEKEVPVSTQQKNYSSPDQVTILPYPLPKTEPKKVEKKQTIILGKKNTLVFRGVVNMLSVAKLQQEAILMSAKLDANTPIYLVLDTPGGSVLAGQILVDTLKALPNKVHTITLFSASMGYHIVQRMDDRLILPSGTLMSHRMYVRGIEGQVPGEAVTAMNNTIRLANKLDAEVSERIGMPVNQYRELIRDELWLDGSDSIKMNMADREVLALCGKDMMGTYTEKINLLFFIVDATWSECPLIRFPVKLQISDGLKTRAILAQSEIEVKRAEYQKFVDALMYDRAKFVRDYVITEKYKEFIAE